MPVDVPGKLVIDLASAGASPRPCPWCRRSTAGNSASWSSCRGPPGTPWCRRAARGADDRRREACRAASWSSTWQRRGLPAAVPVVPTIDAGQAVADGRASRSSTWQRAAVPVRADDRRREACRVRASWSSTWQAPGPPRGRARADDRRREARRRARRSSCRGHRPGNVPPRSPWCRRSTPASSKGKLTAGKWSSTWQVPGPPRGRARADDRRRAAADGQAVIADVPPRSPWCRRSTPASSKGKLTPASRSSTWQAPGPSRGRARGADDRRREATAGNSASRSSTWQAPRPSRGRARADDRRRAESGGKLIAGQAGHRPGHRGACGAVPPVPTIDGGKRAESGQGGHRPGKRRGFPRGRARADVPTIDRRAEIQAGKLTAGKPVIDLASAGASPRPCPWCRRSTAGNSGKPVIVPRSPWCRRAGPWCRRSTPASACRKLTAGKPVIDLERAAVPVVPTIDAGQFQGQADGGQAGHRPGKCRGLPRGRARAARGADVPRRARGADDRRRETDAGQGGHRPGNVSDPRGADDRRRQAPTAGQAGHRADVDARSSTWQRAAVPVVPTCCPWCRRSTAGS